MNFLLNAAAGALAGVLSGFGVGGGTLLLLWLTAIGGMNQLEAAGINLLYFFCCAAPAVWGHAKGGLIDKKTVALCALSALPAAAAGALFAAFMDLGLLRRLFGVLLLFAGLREFFSKEGAETNKASLRGQNTHKTKREEVKNMTVINRIALALNIIGGINWGLVGIFKFDLVAWLCGGQDSVAARIIYTLVGLCALWCISLLFKPDENA